ncbi:uncharacterized protein LOC143297407 [Babylonia areolata]|uniref:uncharacterized protein LOC143297407 n=1 Tax=Babylonia areolata TaxID=304850 RepID=UPI003FD2585C
MELPISRASAFQKRNRTTHSWYGDWSSAGCIMSQSCPSARTLEEHMRNARKAMSVSSSFYQPRASSSPSAIKARSLPGAYSGRRGTRAPPSSSASSPGPTTAVKIPQAAALAKGPPPSTSYSYDGGFFVTANNANKDFFVIDPEWVSEEGTIKKMPEGKAAAAAGSKNVAAAGKPTGKAAGSKNYKRSKSAPPTNHRVVQNPITWQY